MTFVRTPKKKCFCKGVVLCNYKIKEGYYKYYLDEHGYNILIDDVKLVLPKFIFDAHFERVKENGKD